jgi:putative Ca2+/H+ antiporter (TMEM165/GDT1 family)
MDKNVFITSFVAVFVAELGDKTQLATLSLSTGAKARWMVFAGSALALVCTSAIAVMAGDAVSRFISPVWLRRAAGGIFIVLGVLYLLGIGQD